MRRAALASAAVIGVTATLATAVAAPAWARAAGLDVWNVPEMVEWKKAEDRRTADLWAAHARLQDQREATAAVVDELIDGRVTLAEAAEEVEEINRANPT